MDSADEADELAEQKAAAMSVPKKAVVEERSSDDEIDEGFVEVGKSGKAIVENVTVNVFERLTQVLEARGKKV